MKGYGGHSVLSRVADLMVVCNLIVDAGSRQVLRKQAPGGWTRTRGDEDVISIKWAGKACTCIQISLTSSLHEVWATCWEVAGQI